MMPISWILPRARAMFPDRPAIVDGEIRHTFEQLGRRVDALVAVLKASGDNLTRENVMMLLSAGSRSKA